MNFPLRFAGPTSHAITYEKVVTTITIIIVMICVRPGVTQRNALTVRLGPNQKVDSEFRVNVAL